MERRAERRGSCVRAVLLAALTAAAGCGGAPGPGTAGAAPAPSDPIQAADSLLRARVAALSVRSITWRAALDTVRAHDFPVLIARPEQVRRLVPGLRGYRAEHLGEVVPLRSGAGTVVGAVVTVDVDRLERLARGAGLPRAMVVADIDRILIHEIYGHVVPLSRTGRVAGGCPDPAPGASPFTSCAITRENRIRRELGLEPRTRYDLRGLAIGRHLRSFDGLGTPVGATARNR